MLDGAQGEAVAAAMDLLVPDGEGLGAGRLGHTDHVGGANLFGPRHRRVGGPPPRDGPFPEQSLGAPPVLPIPPVRAQSYQLIGPMDTKHWQVQGLPQAEHDEIVASEQYN